MISAHSYTVENKKKSCSNDLFREPEKINVEKLLTEIVERKQF